MVVAHGLAQLSSGHCCNLYMYILYVIIYRLINSLLYMVSSSKVLFGNPFAIASTSMALSHFVHLICDHYIYWLINPLLYMVSSPKVLFSNPFVIATTSMALSHSGSFSHSGSSFDDELPASIQPLLSSFRQSIKSHVSVMLDIDEANNDSGATSSTPRSSRSVPRITFDHRFVQAHRRVAQG